MSSTISAIESAHIFRFVLDKPQAEVAVRIEELVAAIRALDEAHCSARDEMSRAERDHARRVLIGAREVVAKTTRAAA